MILGFVSTTRKRQKRRTSGVSTAHDILWNHGQSWWRCTRTKVISNVASRRLYALPRTSMRIILRCRCVIRPVCQFNSSPLTFVFIFCYPLQYPTQIARAFFKLGQIHGHAKISFTLLSMGLPEAILKIMNSYLQYGKNFGVEGCDFWYDYIF